MWSVFKLFDGYTIRARIIPALIAGLPSLALPFVIVPWHRLGLSSVIVTTMSFVLLYAFADVARRGGYRVERKLRTRSTPELWHRKNSELPSGLKNQFRTFVGAQIKQRVPTEEEETSEPEQVNDFYTSANSWLRDETRDKKKFNILYDELLTYGFRRNLLGVKYLSLAANFLVATIVAAILFYMPPYFESMENIEEKLSVIAIVTLMHSIYMIFAVNKESVKQASKTYGKQLILSCGALMKAARASRNKANRE